MGWKSTIDITRSQAKELIIKELTLLEDKTNDELAEMVAEFGYGDDLDKPYFGYNFNVIDD